MSSTRHKSENDPGFYLNRFASSPAFERGIPANLVAKRCSLLNKKEERALVWFVHLLSWQSAGLDGLSNYLEKRDVMHCSETALAKLCVDPDTGGAGKLYSLTGLTWYLERYRADYIKEKRRAYTTALGKKVSEILDYTAYSRGLTLMEGEARTGKSFAARAWCDQQAGLARFVEVPTGNDDSGFYRALARGLGIGNFLQYKAREIRERVESVLLTGDIVLVLDEAHRLWPQRNLRYGFPGRVEWVMSMSNAGVPIAMVSTPQFLTTQKAVEKSGWNSAQLNGRISRCEPLPRELSVQDLMNIAKTLLPEADAYYSRAMAAYARKTARYLGAIDAIAKRARYLAMKAGRDTATPEEIKTAMLEIAPSDTRLIATMGKARPTEPMQPDDPPPMPGNRIAGRLQAHCNEDSGQRLTVPV